MSGREGRKSQSRFSKFIEQVTRVASSKPASIPQSSGTECVSAPAGGFLIFEDRPGDLPAKPSNEKRLQDAEHERLRKIVRRKYEMERKNAALMEVFSKMQEHRKHELVSIWRTELLPHWFALQRTKRVHRVIRDGIPSCVRKEVWPLLVPSCNSIDQDLFQLCLEVSHERLKQSGSLAVPLPNSSSLPNDGDDTRAAESTNICPMCSYVFTTVNSSPLRHELCLGYNNQSPRIGVSRSTILHSPSELPHSINNPAPLTPHFQSDRTLSLKSIKLDVSRTFPALGLFQPGNPFHDPLHDILAAYVTYRPEIGYVQGMSFLAAIVLLVMHDSFDAFVMFTTILDRPCHRAFYSLNENEFMVYFRAFNIILEICLPKIHSHFQKVGLEPNMYLFDWFFTIFSRSFPLEVVMRVWDLFFFDGEVALFRAALGILQLHEDALLRSTFDQLATFLTSPMSVVVSADTLVKSMHSIGLKKKTLMKCIQQVRLQLSAPTIIDHLKSSTHRQTFFPNIGLDDVKLNFTDICPTLSIGDRLPGPLDHSVISLHSISDDSISLESNGNNQIATEHAELENSVHSSFHRKCWDRDIKPQCCVVNSRCSQCTEATSFPRPCYPSQKNSHIHSDHSVASSIESAGFGQPAMEGHASTSAESAFRQNRRLRDHINNAIDYIP